MAIYQDANGQWRNSDETAYGDPGIPIPPPAGYGGNGGNGGSPPLAPYTYGRGQPWEGPPQGASTQPVTGYYSGNGGSPPLATWPRTTAVQGVTRPATSITSTQVQGVTTPSGRSGVQGETAGRGGRRLRTLYTPAGPWQAEMTDEDYDTAHALMTKTSEDAARQVEFSNGLQQGQLDAERARDDALRAYQQALVETRNQELAYQAARDAMEMSYKQQLLALQRQQLMYSRRRGGYGMRSARVRIV